jgi:hypothetical protein
MTSDSRTTRYQKEKQDHAKSKKILRFRTTGVPFSSDIRPASSFGLKTPYWETTLILLPAPRTLRGWWRKKGGFITIEFFSVEMLSKI